jgi:hypothetical protein
MSTPNYAVVSPRPALLLDTHLTRLERRPRATDTGDLSIEKLEGMLVGTAARTIAEAQPGPWRRWGYCRCLRPGPGAEVDH